MLRIKVGVVEKGISKMFDYENQELSGGRDKVY
jgi:hypothetical protein